MSSPPASSTKRVVRFCGSCAVTLFCWSLWIAMSATLAMLAYVATAEELPVPSFVLRRIERDLARADLALTFGRARLDPKGQVLLDDVKLRTLRFADPVITSRLVYVRRSFWSILAGQPLPDEVRLEGATVQVPALLSPSGTVEPILRDVVLHLSHTGRDWQIHQFTARAANLTVVAEGHIKLPPLPRGQTPLTMPEITRRFLKFSRQLAIDSHRLDAFEQPLLALEFNHRDNTGNTVDAVFTALGAQDPWALPLKLGAMHATTSLPLDGAPMHSAQIHAEIARAVYQDNYTAETVRAIVTAEIVRQPFTLQPQQARIAAGLISGRGERVIAPVLRLDLGEWPRVHAEIATSIRGEALAARADAQLAEKSALVAAEGRVSHELISAVLSEITPRAAPYFVFGDPVGFRAEAVFDPGWKFARLRSWAEGGRLDSRGVGITELRGRVDIDGMQFLAHDAIVRLGDNYARGSYWMDFSTTDYRMLLHGQLRPIAINGWFRGNWWADFWNNNFDFSAAIPSGDIDLTGRWREAERTVYFGRATAPAAAVFGADFADLNTLIFLRPNFTHALELSGTRAGGAQFIAGNFKRFTAPATRDTNRVEFVLDSTLDAETYLKLTRGKASLVLDGLKLQRAPRLHAEGAVDGRWPGAVPQLTFTGHVDGGLHFYDFPLESARVRGSLQGPELTLSEVQFAAAGGRGSGTARLSGPPEARVLGFDVQVAGADLPAAIRATKEFQARRDPTHPPTTTGDDFIKRAAGGKLDVALVASGTPGNLTSFSGTGSSSLTGANLGEIQLFGLLSEALSGLSLNFSSLKLDTARTSLRMDRGKLHFPDLRITGSTAIIEARGDYVFDTSALDFTAKLKPFGENRNLFTAAIGLVINPITSILELKLSGPIAQPAWSVNVGTSLPKENEPVPAVPFTPLIAPPSSPKPVPTDLLPVPTPDRK